MRLTVHSDYALRVLMFAGLRGERFSTIDEIARGYAVSKAHLTKVVWALSREGFLETQRGKGGGLRLARAPEAINLGAVLRATEDNQALVECFGPNGACVVTPACAARRMFREGLEAFLAVFDKYTVADLLGADARLRDLLPSAAEG